MKDFEKFFKKILDFFPKNHYLRLNFNFLSEKGKNMKINLLVSPEEGEPGPTIDIIVSEFRNKIRIEAKTPQMSILPWILLDIGIKDGKLTFERDGDIEDEFIKTDKKGRISE
jgi:hypothetical protein